MQKLSLTLAELINDTTLAPQGIWVSLNSQARVGLDDRNVLDVFLSCRPRQNLSNR